LWLWLRRWVEEERAPVAAEVVMMLTSYARARGTDYLDIEDDSRMR
jgi:hypothetical protein